MNHIQTQISRFDRFQQSHKFTAFTYAVIKKYSQDQVGREAALLTYYGFLSLFPMLLLLTTITDSILGNGSHLKVTIVKGLTNYFPQIGGQLSAHVHTLHKSGFALIISLLFILYGTRGVAEAFKRGVQTIWLVPLKDREEAFLKSLIRSIGLIVVGGSGLILASVLAGLASAAGQGLGFRLLSLAVNITVLFLLFKLLLNFSLPRRLPLKKMWMGAAVATVGLVTLQLLGGYILSREIRHLNAFYSYFALALGLLFWLYLQTQVLFYSIEIAVVSSKKLWPRSIETANATEVDQRLLTNQ